jgi:hypothetical protein
MNQFSIFTLKALHKIYAEVFSIQPLAKPECIQDADIASKLIYDKLTSNDPCMIARFGATELMTMVNYLGIHKKGRKNIFKYIQGQELDWWWNKNCLQQMKCWSGFFPSTVEKIEQFCELMMEDMKEVDILGSWLADEKYFESLLTKDIIRVNFETLNPFFAKKPWTKALWHKKVLVVHPFSSTIEQQFKRRELLFKNIDILPSFELYTIKAIQSLGGQNEQNFKDWFAALDWMETEIDKYDYDICLIGCGAYGFPLAAHVKRKGKKAIHLGGALQLLFGIKGKRWEDPNYNTEYNYVQLMNKYWIKALPEEKPASANRVENECYW